VIRCNLARLMGERKMKISDVAEQTGLHRSRVALLYSEKVVRVDLDVLERLCRLFECDVGAMLEIIEDD
jgi:putative transcriptional regulator